MKNNQFILTLLLIMVMLVACSEDKMSYTDDTSANNELLPEDVEALLSSFLNDDVATKGGVNFTIQDYTVKNYSTYEVETENGDILKKEQIPVYEYAITSEEGEGFALVVGDKRLQKVLAIVENGSIDDTTYIEPLKWYIQSIPALITDELVNYKLGTNVATKAVAETHLCLVPTTWGQDYPYNNNCPPCPSNTNTSYNGRAPAGCVPIAIAQILAYHRVTLPGITPNWNEILTTPSISPTASGHIIANVGYFLRHIGNELYQMDTSQSGYGCSGTGFYLELLSNFFYLKLNMISDKLDDFDLPNIKNSLRANRPVIMKGFSPTIGHHAWVTDGFRSDNYLHMNWGWGGRGNGYFYSIPMQNKDLIYNITDKGVNLGTFNGEYKIITNIRKR